MSPSSSTPRTTIRGHPRRSASAPGSRWRCCPRQSAAPTRRRRCSRSTTTCSTACSPRAGRRVAETSLDILLPALLAGLLVLATHVPLGRLVLERGIVFIDLAIAQVAGLGVVLASFAGWEAHGIAVQLSAAAAALASAGFLIWTERRMPQV